MKFTYSSVHTAARISYWRILWGARRFGKLDPISRSSRNWYKWCSDLKRIFEHYLMTYLFIFYFSKHPTCSKTYRILTIFGWQLQTSWPIEAPYPAFDQMKSTTRTENHPVFILSIFERRLWYGKFRNYIKNVFVQVSGFIYFTFKTFRINLENKNKNCQSRKNA